MFVSPDFCMDEEPPPRQPRHGEGMVTPTYKARPSRETALCEIKERIKKTKLDNIAEHHLGKDSLAGQESLARSRPPQGQVQDFPGRLAGAAKGKLPRQDSTTPPHSDASHLSVRCRAPK